MATVLLIYCFYCVFNINKPIIHCLLITEGINKQYINAGHTDIS